MTTMSANKANTKASTVTEGKERTRAQKFLDENLWPMIIVAILTATVAMNAVVVTVAMQHPPELVTDHYYEKGANLKQVVGEKQATERTGWKVTAKTLEDNSLVVLSVIDAAGLPCDSIAGSCALYRPSDKRLDQTSVQVLPMGNGQYAVKPAMPLTRGAWECVAELSRGEKVYHNRVALFVN